MFKHKTCQLIGMVHTLPLPGSPNWTGQMAPILDRAKADAEALVQGGCDAILIENMGDLPYLNGSVYPETVAALAMVCHELRTLSVPMGVQILAGANEQALAVAATAGAAFIRVEGFAYGHVADEGWMNACAGPLLRKRANLGASVHIWADIQKKHAAHALTADLSLRELADGSAFSGADALIVTGRATGQVTALNDVKEAKLAGLPVIVGSGICPDNLPELAQEADGVIVGSYLKVDGLWQNPVDIQRVRHLRKLLA